MYIFKNYIYTHGSYIKEMRNWKKISQKYPIDFFRR